MLAYVELLALRPSEAREQHVAALRQTGFTDEQIFEIVMVTAHYALRCRMADGLGVELDARVKRDAALVQAFAYRADLDG